MTRFRPFVIALLGMAFLMAVSPPTSAQDDAQGVFDTVYGAKLKQVKSTATSRDDLQLVDQLLLGAQEATGSPKLAVLICDAAYDLAHKHVLGYDKAVAAMEMLAKLDASRKADAHSNIIDLRLRQFKIAKPDERAAIGGPLVNFMAEAAETYAADGDFESAADLYRQAWQVALRIRSPHVDTMRSRYDAFRKLVLAQEKADKLVEDLRETPGDAGKAAELVELYVVDLDQPEKLVDYIGLLPDGVDKDRAVQLTLPPDKLTNAQVAGLADYYRKESRTAPRGVKYNLLSRAAEYYGMLEERDGVDSLLKTRAKLTVTQIQSELARLSAAGEAPVNIRVSSNRWTVIFRSDNPRNWNQKVDADGHFAIPISEAPQDVRYLKLTRTDTRASVIIPISNAKLTTNLTQNGVGWNGTSRYAWGSRSLGLYKTEWQGSTTGEVYPGSPGLGRGYRGWGFGIVHNDRSAGQGFAWGGKRIDKTTFEIAVSTLPLATYERSKLLYRDDGGSVANGPNKAISGSNERWTVLFRSDNPKLWNTNHSDRNDYAVTVDKAPDDIKYVRLRRMDTRQYVIVPVTKDRLRRISHEGGVGWAGGERHWDRYHLGVYREDWKVPTRTPNEVGLHGGLITTYRGWGIGRLLGTKDQHGYTWNGKKLPRAVAFEVAVTATRLTPIERRLMVRP